MGFESAGVGPRGALLNFFGTRPFWGKSTPSDQPNLQIQKQRIKHTHTHTNTNTNTHTHTHNFRSKYLVLGPRALGIRMLFDADPTHGCPKRMEGAENGPPKE